MMSYKYDFELSSKRSIFLWLYQVLPNIDLIKWIYKLKLESELETIQSYHGLCPRHIRTTGSWDPRHIDDPLKIMNLRRQMDFNTLFIKLIMDDGFICEVDHDEEQLEYIQGGEYTSTNINYKPSLTRKIKCINLMYDDLPLLSIDTIRRMYEIYINSKHAQRIGIDQNNNIYIPIQ